MKSFFFGIILIIPIAGIISSFDTEDRSGVRGTIEPFEGVKIITAMNDQDTVSKVPTNGSFILDLKPGTWKIVIETVSPFKKFQRDFVTVYKDQFTDIGYIKLEK